MPLRCLPLLLALLALPAVAEEYVVDPEHTYASFEIDHLGFSTLRGRFNRSSGSIDFDPAAQQVALEIRIAAASLDTGFEVRDDILRGEQWFNVRDFPDILFRSQAMLFDGERPQAVEGTLIMLGTMRPLRLEITRFKCGFNLVRRQKGCGADAEGTLRRSDFGLNNGIPFVGDEVRLRIQIEAYPP
ncbi:MAG TPA: YceI family protein [Azonexus sp.]